MKYLIVSISLLLIYSCAQPVKRYSVVIPRIHPDSIKTLMLPVSEGNFWQYEINNFLSKKRDTVIIEVLGLDTIQVHADGKDTSILAYKLNWNKSLFNENNKSFYYYIKSEKQTQLVKAIKPETKKISYYLDVFYEDPGMNMIDPEDSDIKWVGMKSIITKYGKKNCYYSEITLNEYIPERRKDNLVYQVFRYNLKGVGIIKEECYNSKGVVIIERNLINYLIK